MDDHRFHWRRSILRRPFLTLLILSLPGIVQANNPGVSPQMITLVKSCPGANCDQQCQWTGGKNGDIRGNIRIDDIKDVDITKIEVRSTGDPAWHDSTASFTITRNGVDPTTADGEIVWSDPFGNNNVPVGCGLAVDESIDLRVTTTYTPPIGQPVVRVWLLQVTLRLNCEPCGVGEVGALSTGNQCHTANDFDRDLLAGFSIINKGATPQQVVLTLTDEAGWLIQPPLPPSVDLLPGEVRTFPVFVTLPGGTPDGFSNTVTLVATPGGSNLASTNFTTMTFTIDEACAPQLLSTSLLVPAMGKVALALLGLLLGAFALLAVRRRVRA